MKMTKRHGLVKSVRRIVKPYRVVLHHTGGSTASGAIATLASRGLGYHYLITKKGAIQELVPANRRTYHARGANTGTVGISFVCGGRAGPVNKAQIHACVRLLKKLKSDYPTLRELTGHKHVDTRGKSDPQWYGEKPEKVDWAIDYKYMRKLAKETGYQFMSRKTLRGRSTWTKLRNFLRK